MTKSSPKDRKRREAKYRPILLQRQQQLTARLEKIEHDFQRPPNRDDDDRAVERNNDEVLEELRETGQKELVAIEAAFRRMTEGGYGICVKCYSPISDQRLDVVPYTPFCQSCAIRPGFVNVSSRRKGDCCVICSHPWHHASRRDRWQPSPPNIM